MTVTTVNSENSAPLSPAQLQQLANAQDRAAKIRRAAAVAGFNGGVTGVLAACSAPFALFSLPGAMVTIALALVAHNEFRGRRRLLQFDGQAPAFLGWNQVGFLTMIIFYCIWMLFIGLTSQGPFSAKLAAKPELGVAFASVGEFDHVYKLVVIAVYTTTIALSTVFQGWNAAYYFTRRKHIQAYVQNTPDWVLDLQRLNSAT